MGDVLRLDLDKVKVDPAAEYEMVGVLSFGKGLFHRETVAGARTSYSTLYRLGDNHIVLSQLFGWEGAIALSSADFAGKHVSTQFPTFVTDEDHLSREFLGCWIKQARLWKELKAKSKGMGDRRRTITPQAFLSCEINLPQLSDQKRIAESLNSVSARVAEAKRLRAGIQADTRALLHSIFHRLLQGAAYRPLGEVAPIVRRRVEIELDGEYPELGVRGFGNGVFHKPTLLGADLDWQKLFRIEPGDLIVSNIKAWEGAIAVAAEQDQGRVASHRYITCVPRTDLATAEFLCFYLLTDEGNDQIQAASPGSADRNRTLAMNRLEQIRVPLPPIEKQQQFTALQAKAQAIRTAQAANQAELDALLPAVLDKVFKGRL